MGRLYFLRVYGYVLCWQAVNDSTLPSVSYTVFIAALTQP